MNNNLITALMDLPDLVATELIQTDPINGKLIEVLSSRKKKDFIEYFNTWPKGLREKIKYFSMNMWSPL